MKSIGVVLINYNSEENTIECIASLLRSKVKDSFVQIVVVDNSASMKNAAYFKENLPKNSSSFAIHYIENKINTGFSGGCNTGIKFLIDQKVEGITLLNNDTLVDENLLSELVLAAENNKSVGIVCPKIYFAKGFEFHSNRYKEQEKGHVIWYAGGIMDWKNIIGHHRGVDEVDVGQFDERMTTEIATGCCMYIKSEVFKNIGLFNEKFFLYYEDADFSMRVKKAGFSILYLPSAVLWHKNAESAGGSGSTLQDYYISRNRMLFGVYYASLRTKLSLVRESIKILTTGRNWQKKGVIDFYLMSFYKGSYKMK